MTDSFAAGVSPSVPTVSCVAPRPVRLAVLGSGVSGGAYETVLPAMALSSLTRWQASSGEWVFLGLRSRRACSNTVVCARAAPLLFPVTPSDNGHSRLVSWCPARFTPSDPFVALGPSWVFMVPVSLLPSPPPPPFPVQLYVDQYPPSQREIIFVVALLAFTPPVSPVPDFLTA